MPFSRKGSSSVYRVLYRKYRPASFDDVWGQPQVTTILRRQITSGKLAHAYLFTGSRGIGKTTCAKILAKAVNCLHPVNGDPCNECEVCRGIDDESIHEVVEMDAASNNGVGDVRDLQERLVFPPTNAKYRVYIIDEVHMMSDAAFNALLKTLEEPPEHVIFILATTEVHELPATILSRCQRLDFRRISAEDIAGRLEEIAASEGCSVERDAALLIARVADGGMRDAISLFDQCLARSNHVTEDIVRDAAGLAGSEHIFELSAAICACDSAAVLIQLDRLHQLSKDMQRLCEELISHFRSLMIINTVSDPQELIIATSDQLEQYRKDAAGYSLQRIMRIIDTLQTALENMSHGAHRRTELEMALLRICRDRDEAQEKSVIAELEKRIHSLEGAIRSGAVATAPARSESQPAPIITGKSAAVELSDKAVPFEQWGAVLEKLDGRNKALSAVLSGSQAFIVDDCCLIDSTDLAKDMLRQPTARQVLRDLLIETTGKSYRLGGYTPTSSLPESRPSPLDAAIERARKGGVEVNAND